MTQRTEPRLKMPRHRRGRAELEALRTLAREAALRGESLASIRARLHIPEPTLTSWARQDGYRQIDLKARAEAQKEAEAAEEAARGEGAAAVEAIREQAGELWDLCEEMQDRPTTGARRQVELARARTLAPAEAGHLEAAEEEMASVRRLARLLAFGCSGTGEMERFQTRAALLAEDLEFQAALSGPPDEDAPYRRHPWTALIEARKQLAEARGEDEGKET